MADNSIDDIAHLGMVEAAFAIGGLSAEEASAISFFLRYCLWRRDASSFPPCPAESLVQDAINRCSDSTRLGRFLAA